MEECDGGNAALRFLFHVYIMHLIVSLLNDVNAPFLCAARLSASPRVKPFARLQRGRGWRMRAVRVTTWERMRLVTRGQMLLFSGIKGRGDWEDERRDGEEEDKGGEVGK